MKRETSRAHKDKEQALLTFLKKTKEGEFTEVRPVDLTYVRVSESTEPDYEEEAYFFSYG
jgi:hypothetical protein